MRSILISGVLLLSLVPLQGTTLQQLGLDEMTRKSTEIVRGKVQSTGSGLRGPTLYTYYRVQVSEQWKGMPALQLDVAVPGGASNGVHQTYAGAPAMLDGQDFVLFLWTSRSGLRQVIGLSQGLFNVRMGATGQLTVSRTASTEQMLDANGQPVNDRGYSMSLADLRARVASTLTGSSH